MRRPRPSDHDHDERIGPASGPRDPTTDDLITEHGAYLLALLASYGIPAQDVEEVAQTVWLHVHRRRGSYDATRHKTRRAWITGFAERCAANYRRTQRRRPLSFVEDAGDLWPAPGLSAEQAAILANLHELIPNDDQRLALLLRVRHGLSIAEIAAVQGVEESTVQGRLAMARKALKRDDDEKKSCAYLGFGSMEALADALEPGPVPPEACERVRQRVAERIRQQEPAPGDSDPSPSSYPPAPALPVLPSPLPPAAALPAPTSPTGAALVALSAPKLAGILMVAFLGGAGTGLGGLLAWRACEAARHGHIAPAVDPAPVTSAAPATSVRSTPAPATRSSAGVVVSAASSTPARPMACSSPSTTPSTPARLTASSRPSAAPSAAPGSAAAPSTAAPGTDESQRLLARMRLAAQGQQLSEVLGLAEQHERRFGAMNSREREALRIEALRGMGRGKDADEHARAVIAAYPRQRRQMERAAGHALP